MGGADKDKRRPAGRLHELANDWKPEVIPRGNERVLDWWESISRVEGAYPVHFFEVSGDPGAIARFKYLLGRCKVVESPTHSVVPYGVAHAVRERVGLSGRLKIFEATTRRLSLFRSRDGH